MMGLTNVNIWAGKKHEPPNKAAKRRCTMDRMYSAAADDAELTALMSSMSSGKVCIKFMTLSLTGSLSTPPSCNGWK